METERAYTENPDNLRFLPVVEWLSGHSTKAFQQWTKGRAQKRLGFLSRRRRRDILTKNWQEQTNDRKNHLLYR